MNFVYVLSVVLFISKTSGESSATSGPTDETQTPSASGPNVVETTIRRIDASCSFDDNTLFLRRLAYVESTDGLHPDTFRSGYYGGIWQVDQAMYGQTKGSTLQSYIDAIEAKFLIAWRTTNWSDLLKPLHSALAARLYIQKVSRGIDIARSITQQADFWERSYRPGRDRNSFISATRQQGCDSKGLDLVFVLDGSGSIGLSDFRQTLQFVKDTVNNYEIGPDQTRVGVIQYSSSVIHEFALDTYNTKNDVINAVQRISYMGGSTATFLALDALVEYSFQETNGARPLSQGHPRVGVVLTDGGSDSQSRTTIAANRVHEAEVNTIAIGVGSSLDHSELEAIASQPVCLNMFTLGFSDLGSLFYAVEKRACEAPINLFPHQNGNKIEVTGSSQNCKLSIMPEGTTVKLETHTGSSTLYVANDAYPSQSYYENKAESVPGRNGVMYIQGSGGKMVAMYCNIQGDATETNEFSGTIETKPGVSPGYNCRNNNPCTPENIQQHKYYHPHDNPNKFVLCNPVGQCLEIACGAGMLWEPAVYACLPNPSPW